MTPKQLQKLISLLERTAEVCRIRGKRLEQLSNRLEHDEQRKALHAIAEAFIAHARVLDLDLYKIRQDLRGRN